MHARAVQREKGRRRFPARKLYDDDRSATELSISTVAEKTNESTEGKRAVETLVVSCVRALPRVMSLLACVVSLLLRRQREPPDCNSNCNEKYCNRDLCFWPKTSGHNGQKNGHKAPVVLRTIDMAYR